MADLKIAIIGGGNIGLSLAGGLSNIDEIPNNNITVTRRNLPKIQHLSAKDINVTSDNCGAVREADIVVLCVKPYNVEKICEEIKDELKSDHILISTASEISISSIEKAIDKDLAVFRAMPNTAAKVSESITCICDNGVEKEDYQKVEMMFNALGKCIRINEDLMEAATILGACGVAYVLRFMRAMVQGGIQIGFDANTASDIVNQTVKGAAQLIIQDQHHPEEEIDKVTTPKGCTIVGLNEMEHNGFSSSLIKGIVASFEKIED